MRIGNRKFERPTAEEMAAGQGYTPEELAAIEEAKHVLWKTELNLKDANALWMKLLAQVDVVALPPLRVASMVAQTRHIRFEARRNRREAYLNYFDACVPRRLRLYRDGKLMGGFIKDRLAEPSFMERILPPVPVEPSK